MESLRGSIQERAKHKQEYDRRMNDRMMQSKEGKVDSSKALDAGLVVTESNETELERHVSSSRSGKDTHAEDADINSMNDKQPMAQVQLFAEHNIRANKQQHSEQSESVYDIYLLEKVDRNTIPKSIDMSHRGGEIDQHADAEKNVNKTVENADLKAQIQEKVFANVALKTKLKGNSVDTKFAKPSILGKPDLQPPRNQSVRICVCKTSSCDCTGSSRNSSKELYLSNDMAYNYYLEEAKKKTQDKNRNLKPRDMPSARTHHTPNAYHSRNPSSFLDSKHFVCSTCQKCVFNANHDACITKFLKEVNSRVRVQSPKTRNNNKPVEPKIHTQEPGRQIVTGHRFSPNKSSAMHEKRNTPRSCLRWIPTGRIFNTIGLRWVPTGKVDCKPPNGSNEDITDPYECDQTLNFRTGLHDMTPVTSSTRLSSNPVSQLPCLPPKRDDWDRLYQLMFDEYFNPSPIAVSTVQEALTLRAVVLADSLVSISIDQDASSTSIPSTQEKEHSPNISQGFEESPKTLTFHNDPLHEDLTSQGSSSNVRQTHTPFEHLGRWTKDHHIANVIGNPSRSVSTRKQLQTNAMWCYFDTFLTLVEPKNFKQAMTEPSWIDTMQEKIHEFERLQVWELVPCPDKVMLIRLKWIYKVKEEEFGRVLKNKA
ncbi:hypothetical protein Tco_0793416 [Tanacetum coccineum]